MSDTKVRPRSGFYSKSPGPGAYKLPSLIGKPQHSVTHQIRPEFTMAQRLDKILKIPPGPGVGKYGIVWGLQTNGKHLGPEYTFRPRLEPKLKVAVPGPGQHDLPLLEIYRPAAPGFTMRQRTTYFRRNNKCPAPNAYSLPPLLGPRVIERPAQQECTMKGDVGLHMKKVLSPGPAAYSAVRPDTVKNKAPEFTMATNACYKKLWTSKCGPASYDPTKRIFYESPAYSFGTRHNEYVANMYTECDKVRLLHAKSGTAK